jgi:hypothetical protein
MGNTYFVNNIIQYPLMNFTPGFLVHAQQYEARSKQSLILNNTNDNTLSLALQK